MNIHKVYCSDDVHFETKHFVNKEKAKDYYNSIIKDIKNTYKLFGEEDTVVIYNESEVTTLTLKTYGGEKSLLDVIIEIIKVEE